MQTHTITTYKFNELSDSAKSKAIENWRNSTTELFWIDELNDSLQAVFKHAGFKLKNYELGEYHSWIKIDIDDDIGNLTGSRAIGWFENHFLNSLRITRSEYLKNRKAYLSYGSSYRIGYVKPCPFTGYCADDNFIDALTKSLVSGETIKEAFKNLATEYLSLFRAEYESQNSDEYITDTIQANEYDFTEDGEMY